MTGVEIFLLVLGPALALSAGLIIYWLGRRETKASERRV